MDTEFYCQRSDTQLTTNNTNTHVTMSDVDSWCGDLRHRRVTRATLATNPSRDALPSHYPECNGCTISVQTRCRHRPRCQEGSQETLCQRPQTHDNTHAVRVIHDGPRPPLCWVGGARACFSCGHVFLCWVEEELLAIDQTSYNVLSKCDEVLQFLVPYSLKPACNITLKRSLNSGRLE